MGITKTANENVKHNQILMDLYKEICKSYHVIDDYRVKLLSFLPLFSVVGIFFIDDHPKLGHEIIGFAGIFAALFTIALFVYEIRGIIRSDTLIKRGKAIEKQLGFQGQFYICAQEQATISLLKKSFNAKFAACLVYSLVFAAWLFIFLKYGPSYETANCIISAAGTGIAIAVLSNIFVGKLLAA